MRVLEGVFLWVTISLYVVSLLLFLWRAVFKNERQELYAWKCWLIGFCTHSATILVRWIESGHPPVLWPYEHGLLSTWFIALIFILAGRWVPGLKILGIVVSPAVLMILGYGIMNQGIGIEPLPPPYRSNWLWVHVTFAWLAYGAFAFTAVVALLYIIRHMAPRFTGKAVLKWLPSPEVLDDLIFRVIIFGFAGIMSYQYGLTSSGAIVFIIFSAVLFFDVGLGIMPNPIGAVPHFITFFMAIALVGVIIKEAMS